MMIQPRIFFYGILLCILFAFSTSAAATTRMPEFLLPNVLDGKSLSSSSFSGKALFVTFFATWCPPCIEEVPTLIKLQAKYGKDDFSVIGLSVDQGGAKVVKKLVEKKSINYPVVLATAQTMQDFGGVYGIPVSFLINKKGNVVKKYTGYVSLSVLEKDLKKIL